MKYLLDGLTVLFSDTILEKTVSFMLKLIVRVTNINLPVNHPILKERNFAIMKFIESEKAYASIYLL